MPPQTAQQSQEKQQEVALAPELAVMADALKAVLSQVTTATLPEGTGEQQTALEQLRTVMSSTLQPILGAAQNGGNSYGPASTPAHAARVETAPYHEPATGAAASK